MEIKIDESEKSQTLKARADHCRGVRRKENQKWRRRSRQPGVRKGKFR